jgi:hypothetical protein
VNARFAGAPMPPPAPAPTPQAGPRRSAREQLQSARARIAARRDRARQGRRAFTADARFTFERGPGRGVLIAVGVIALIAVAGGVSSFRKVRESSTASGGQPKAQSSRTVAYSWGDATSKPSAKPSGKAQGQPVLVLREPSALLEPMFTESKRVIDRFKQNGLTILGENEADRVRADELAAAVRSGVGLRPLGESDAAAAVQNWLVTLDGQTAPAVVVWMAQDRARPGVLWSWVVTSRSAGEDVKAAVRAGIGE